MANRTREEMLKFIVATEGDDEIKALVKDLIKLGDSSDASATKANALLGKIESLGQVSNNIQSFTKLKASIKDAGDEIEKAKQKIVTLQAELASAPANPVITAQLEKVNTSAKKFVTNIEATNKKIKELETALEKDTGNEKLSAKLERARATLVRLGEQSDRANTKITDLQKRLAADPNNTALEKQIERAKLSVSNLEKEQNKLTVALTKTSFALSKEGVDVANLSKSFDKLQSELSATTKESTAFANSIGKSGNATAGAGAGISKLGNLSAGAAGAVASVATQLATVAVTATAAAAAVTAIFFKGAVDSAIEFDDALTEVAAVSGATGDALGRLKLAAEEGGAATKFSAVEAAQGLTELARATGNADDAIASLTPTLNLAQAAGIGVADAATILTTTLTQFGLDATQAAKVADLFATEANTTNDTVTGLGNAMSYAAPLARQLGLSVTDTVAIIGALADQGFRGERAGTALRAVFSALLDPADAFSVALRELGIDSTNFNEVIEQLATKGNAGRDAILKLDAAARPAILALVGAGTAGIAKLNESLAQSAGSATQFAQVIGSSFSAGRERMSGEFDQMRRDLVKPLLEPVIIELNKLAEEFNKFAKSEDFKLLKAELQELFTEAGLAVKDFIGEVDLVDVVQNIRQFVVDSKQSIAEFRTAISGIAIIIETMGDGIVLTFNVIQTAIYGLAALVSKTIAIISSTFDFLTGPGRKIGEMLGVNTDNMNAFSDAAITFGDVASQNATLAYENLGEAGGALVDLAGQAEESSARTTVALSESTASTEAAAVASTNLAAAGIESASGILQQTAAAEAAAGKTAALATENEQASQRIKTAFADLGLKTQAELNNTADSARRNFDVIVDAADKGKAATEDVRRAFVAYAQAAIAAAKDSNQSARDRVNAELSVKAASLGVSDVLAQMGVVGGAATGAITSGANQASTAVSSIGDSAGYAAQKTEDLASAAAKAGGSIQQAAQAQQTMTASLGDGSRLWHQINTDANRFAVAGLHDQWRNTINQNFALRKDQLRMVEDAANAIEKENLQYDETEKKLVELRKQYPLLADSQLVGLVQVQEKLEQNRLKQKQIADEKRNQNRAAVAPTSASPIRPPRAGSSGSENVVVVRLEVGNDSVDLHHFGGDEALRRTLRGLAEARTVSIKR